MTDPGGPIALFDSGIGGLSVLRYVRALLPYESIVYLADQAHVPYGPRPAGQIRQLSEAITTFLLEQHAKVIVVACNTATAAALSSLRAAFPTTSFVGMEPAVKPGAAQTRTGKVGVLATAGTFESQRYVSLMHRFARDVVLFESPCAGLVEQIEAGALATAETAALLADCLEPMLAAGIDTLVLGCTHYPFVRPLLEQLVGPTIMVIDPAPAVARQVERVLRRDDIVASSEAPGRVQAYTTGSGERLAGQIQRLLGASFPVSELCWQGHDRLVDCEAVFRA